MIKNFKIQILLLKNRFAKAKIFKTEYDDDL